MIIDQLKPLKKELIFLTISVLISAIILIAFYTHWQSSTDNLISAQSSLASAKSRYYSALKKIDLLKQYEQPFELLKRSGIYAEENRLNWVDAVETSAIKSQAPSVKYKIHEQKQLSSTKLSSKYPGIDILSSKMKIEMQLLHEADIYRVLNGIGENATGLFDIHSCAISRNLGTSDNVLESETDENFSAICYLNWYSIQKKVFTPVRRSSRRG